MLLRLVLNSMIQGSSCFSLQSGWTCRLCALGSIYMMFMAIIFSGCLHSHVTEKFTVIEVEVSNVDQ